MGDVGLTPNLYDHLMNELLLKADFRDWLSGTMPNKEAARSVREVIPHLSFVFPNAANSYTGLDKIINSLRQPRRLSNGFSTARRIPRPIGVIFEVYDNDRFKVRVTGSDVNGERAITITLVDEWSLDEQTRGGSERQPRMSHFFPFLCVRTMQMIPSFIFMDAARWPSPLDVTSSEAIGHSDTS